jgi:hypothetical protein
LLSVLHREKVLVICEAVDILNFDNVNLVISNSKRTFHKSTAEELRDSNSKLIIYYDDVFKENDHNCAVMKLQERFLKDYVAKPLGREVLPFFFFKADYIIRMF